METKYNPSDMDATTFTLSDIETKYLPSDIDTKYSPSELESKYSPLDFLNGPNTPQSLSDSSSSSPDSFMSSRDTSPLSFASTQITDISPPTSNGDDPKIKQEPEKKPVKKRKSWGQQLPTPTTNLAPRKRAKTAEEKEQRRVERVLRNRAAAQKSREVKKQQLEKIEQERDVLKEQNELLLASNKQLEHVKQQLLERARRLEEENRRLRGDSDPHSSEASVIEDPELDFSITSAFLDPTTLISNCNTIQSDGSISFPSMTHQPAALMCDLPCLQGILTMNFLPVWAIMMVLMEMAFSMFWTNLPTSTLVSRLLQNPLQCFLLIQFWKISSIATGTLLLRATSRVCSSVLAHLRIATDYSSSLTSSAEKASFVSETSSHFVFGRLAEKWMRRRLREAYVDRKCPRGTDNITTAITMYLPPIG